MERYRYIMNEEDDDANEWYDEGIGSHCSLDDEPYLNFNSSPNHDRPHLFHPERTIIIYPLPLCSEKIITEALRFGDIERAKCLMKETIGCLIVVYKHFSSAMAAIECCKHFKRDNFVPKIEVDLLWPRRYTRRDCVKFLLNFGRGNHNVNTEIFIVIERPMSRHAILEQCLFYGIVECVGFYHTSETRTYAHVRFIHQLDAAIAVACCFDNAATTVLNHPTYTQSLLKLKIKDWPYKITEEQRSHLPNLNTFYTASVRDHSYLHAFHQPRQVFQTRREVLYNPGSIDPVFLHVKDHIPCRILMLVRNIMNENVLLESAYEITFNFSFYQAFSDKYYELILTPDKQWTSYFILNLIFRRKDIHGVCSSTNSFLTMNHGFPMLCSRFFDDKEAEFLFARPEEVFYEEVPLSSIHERRALYDRLWHSMELMNDESIVPVFTMVLPKPDRLPSAASFHLPIVVHSNIPIS